MRRTTQARTVPLAMLAVVAFGLSACGAGPAPLGVANAGSNLTTTTAPPTSSTSAGTSTVAEELQYAECMRAHGVSDFPDPSANGGFLNAIAKAIAHAGPNSNLNLNNPTYKAAAHVCEKYTPAAHETPAERSAESTKALEFSQCMRSHGVPRFPDPIVGPGGGEAINLGPEHIDPTSPTYQKAQSSCQRIVPGSK